jgi:hypothetical protein
MSDSTLSGRNLRGAASSPRPGLARRPEHGEQPPCPAAVARAVQVAGTRCLRPGEQDPRPPGVQRRRGQPRSVTTSTWRTGAGTLSLVTQVRLPSAEVSSPAAPAATASRWLTTWTVAMAGPTDPDSVPAQRGACSAAQVRPRSLVANAATSPVPWTKPWLSAVNEAGAPGRLTAVLMDVQVRPASAVSIRRPGALTTQWLASTGSNQAAGVPGPGPGPAPVVSRPARCQVRPASADFSTTRPERHLRR